MNPALPAVIVVGGAVYVLEKQAPPSTLPGGAPNSVYPDGYSIPPSQAYFGLDKQAPDGAAAKVDALLVAAEAKFQQMSDSERSVAAQELNSKLQLQPPLTGRETWQTVASVAGGAAAQAGCSAIPGIGMAAGPLCAIAGSYLGVQLESWLASSLDDVKAWINQNVPQVVGGWLDSVGDYLNHIF